MYLDVVILITPPLHVIQTPQSQCQRPVMFLVKIVYINSPTLIPDASLDPV